MQCHLLVLLIASWTGMYFYPFMKMQFLFLFFFNRAPRSGYQSREPSSLIAFRNFDEEIKHPGVWESDQGASSTTDSHRDNLASLYRPPFHLMLNGPFEKVRVHALTL